MRWLPCGAVAGLLTRVLAPPAPARAGGAHLGLRDPAAPRPPTPRPVPPAAGPLIPDQVALAPCWRSNHNYPHEAADRLRVTTFRDVTCSSATTENMTAPQDGVPPQFDALSRDTTLVTLTIGGNDTGLAGV